MTLAPMTKTSSEDKNRIKYRNVKTLYKNDSDNIFILTDVY